MFVGIGRFRIKSIFKNLALKFGRSENGTKFEINLPLSNRHYSVASNVKWKIFSNFVAFSEYLNFMLLTT